MLNHKFVPETRLEKTNICKCGLSRGAHAELDRERLLEAAPELLEACKRIAAAPHGVALGDLEFLQNAIAKAEDRDA